MLMNTRLFHEDGGCCCGGHGHGEGHGHGDGGCCHGEGHDHGGHCHDDLPEELSGDEKVALLAYMIRHNGHHLDELHTLAMQLDGEAEAYLNDAVELLAQSNEHLVKAYFALTGEDKEAK